MPGELRFGRLPTCPACGAAVVFDDAPTDAAGISKEDELSARRISHLARLRKSAIRRRSHLLLLAIVCVVGAAQLLLSIGRLALSPAAWRGDVRLDTLLFLALYALLLYVALKYARRLLQRAAELKAEYSHSDLTEPATPPDYSTLSDGSAHLRALDEMTRPADGEEDDAR